MQSEPAFPAFDPLVLFERSARERPEREALRINGHSWTYAKLDARASALAARIQEQVSPGERIPFVAHRDLHSYITVLAILKAGCAYVPLAPEGPVARWMAIITKCGAPCIVSDPDRLDAAVLRALDGLGLSWCLPDAGEAAPIHASSPDAEQEAYVLFTSGSTGGPKGVPVKRRNVAAYLQHLLTTFAFTPKDRFTQHFALTFDLSVHDLFVCWGAGGCLCVPPAEGALHAASFVREESITVWFSVPSLAGLLRRMRALAADALPSLRLSFFCGEALTWPVVRAWSQAASAGRIINLYGPTEATIAITSYEVDRRGIPEEEGIVPLGRVFPYHRACTLQEEGPADAGEGELCLQGPQITEGYLAAPEATAQAFVSFPQVEGRWYRTGDQVRIDADGTAHFLGRIDHQVKVAGHRVEPGEVDAVLAARSKEGNTVTVPVMEGGATRLVTFIDVPVDTAFLMEHLRNELPPYMVPERIIVLSEIPRTPHGKWDRQRLIALAAHG